MHRFLEIKRPGRTGDQSWKLRMRGVCTTTPPYVFMARWWIKCKDSFYARSQNCEKRWLAVSCLSLFASILSPFRATYPAYTVLLDLITGIIFGVQYRSLSSSLCNFLHSLVTSFLLGPNIFLSTLLSNNLSLRSSLSVSEEGPEPY